MELIQYILLGIFVLAAMIGYKLINKVPKSLHTPLMSGMNALSGVTIIGALLATAAALESNNPVIESVFGSLAIILAMINVAGGFAVTHRMLKMFVKKRDDKNNDNR
jgi:H+-translocating NAD(P) transhydrogenase subunit alpha